VKKIKLRDWTSTLDPRLDRLVQFDDKSRKYPIRTIMKGKKPRSFTWRCNAWLDQGAEGACVGFGVAHELAARPAEARMGDQYAREIYREAKKIDPWPGEDYEGTSVLAGVKVAQKLGWMKSYRWSFSLEDLILGVGFNGPAVMGLAWLEGMSNTDEKGFIHVTGTVRGGHCILNRAVNIKEKYFMLHNSWGRSWGIDGDCKVSFLDMEKLLGMDGEACFFINRVSSLK
jgi:hypothetical protein